MQNLRYCSPCCSIYRRTRNAIHVTHLVHCNIGFHLSNAQHPHVHSRILESIEGFVGVTNKRQTHLGIMLGRYGLCLPLMSSRIVLLWNFVDGEIADIDIGRQLGFKRSSDPTELVPDDAPEEWMLLDL